MQYLDSGLRCVLLKTLKTMIDLPLVGTTVARPAETQWVGLEQSSMILGQRCSTGWVCVCAGQVYKIPPGPTMYRDSSHWDCVNWPRDMGMWVSEICGHLCSTIVAVEVVVDSDLSPWLLTGWVVGRVSATAPGLPF